MTAQISRRDKVRTAIAVIINASCALGYADKEFPKLKGEGQRLEVKILR